MAIPLRPIHSQSGNHVAAGYDPTSEILRVEFKGGKRYDYHGVSPEVASTFFEAPSPGEYLAAVIRPACPASPVKGGE